MFKFDYDLLEEADSDQLQIIYDELWVYRKKTPAEKISWSTARHHFLPESMGGDNSPENYIRITNEEHFIAHYILHKIQGGMMTASFGILAGGLFNTKKNNNTNIEDMVSLFESNEIEIRQEQSKRMQGKNNPSYGLTGSNHPTSSFDKSGSNNPNHGKKATSYCKKQTTKANQGKVVCFDLDEGISKRVSTKEYHKYDRYVGCSSKAAKKYKENDERNK